MREDRFNREFASLHPHLHPLPKHYDTPLSLFLDTPVLSNDFLISQTWYLTI